jgi:predicted RNA-binding Zn ribbon-like protein
MQRNAGKAAASQAPSPFEFSGGALCLDFANTVSHRPAPNRHDLLADFAALVQWSREAGLLSASRARQACRQAMRSPAQAHAELRRAKALREAIYETCSAIAAGRAPQAQQIAALNASLARILADSKLAAHGRRFVWLHSGNANPLDDALWAVARSAADLLASDALAQLRECAADTCGWLFLDRSKNSSRRWCDMRVCGNRAKVQRFRRRVRHSGA